MIRIQETEANTGMRKQWNTTNTVLVARWFYRLLQLMKEDD